MSDRDQQSSLQVDCALGGRFGGRCTRPATVKRITYKPHGGFTSLYACDDHAYPLGWDPDDERIRIRRIEDGIG